VQTPESGEPMQFEVPYIARPVQNPDRIEAVTREEFLKAIQPYIEQVQITGRAQSRANARPKQERENLLKALVRDILQNPFEGLRQRLARLDLSPGRAVKALKALENQGLILPVEVPVTGKRPSKFYALTPRGAAFLGLDWEQVKMKGKGGPEHVFIQNFIAHAVGGLVEHQGIDVVRIRGQTLIGYEYETDPAELHILTNLDKALKLCDELVLVVKTASDKQVLRRFLEKSLGKVPARTKLATVAEVLKDVQQSL